MQRPFVDDFIGDEYYVDASGGSDLNAGTSDATAWQTLGHAIDTGIPAIGYNSTDGVRINIKSNANHSITTSLTSGGSLVSKLNAGTQWNRAGSLIFQVYTSTANDGGGCTIINDCGGSTRFIDDHTTDQWGFVDCNVKAGTSSRLFAMDRGCTHMDCSFTATGTNGDTIYSDRNSYFYRCFFHVNGGIRFNCYFYNCVFINNSTSKTLDDNRIRIANCLLIQYGTASKATMAECGAEQSAFVNVGTGTITNGVSTNSGINHCYFENITTPITTTYSKRSVGSYYGNKEYNCTNQAVSFGTATASGRSVIYEDVETISASPFTAIDETGFTLADGSELQYGLNIGTANGDGWAGVIKRFAGTGGPISGGAAGSSRLINGGLVD